MLAANTIRVNVAHTYKALPCAVYDAWFNPEMAKRFLFSAEEGHIIRLEIDPHAGGHFLIVDRRPTGDAFYYGVFLELQRPRRMAFSLSVEEHDHNPERVEIDIELLGSGSRLTLIHEMCAEWSDFEEKTRQGWAQVLEGLDRELGRTYKLTA